VVPFYFEEDIYTQARDFFMAMVTNGNAPGMVEDFENECETMLKPLENTLMIMKAGVTKRFFIDFILKNIQEKGRQCKVMNGLRK
jgi:hypothetical protein